MKIIEAIRSIFSESRRSRVRLDAEQLRECLFLLRIARRLKRRGVTPFDHAVTRTAFQAAYHRARRRYPPRTNNQTWQRTMKRIRVLVRARPTHGCPTPHGFRILFGKACLADGLKIAKSAVAAAGFEPIEEQVLRAVVPKANRAARRNKNVRAIAGLIRDPPAADTSICSGSAVVGCCT